MPLPWQSFDFPFPFSFFSFFRSVSGPQLSPQESVALLTQAGLFDNAFTVAFHFNLPKETIFEGLASRLENINIKMFQGESRRFCESSTREGLARDRSTKGGVPYWSRPNSSRSNVNYTFPLSPRSFDVSRKEKILTSDLDRLPK